MFACSWSFEKPQVATGRATAVATCKTHTVTLEKGFCLPGRPWTSSSSPSASAWACGTGRRCRPAACHQTVSPWFCRSLGRSGQTAEWRGEGRGGDKNRNKGDRKTQGGKEWITAVSLRVKLRWHRWHYICMTFFFFLREKTLCLCDAWLSAEDFGLVRSIQSIYVSRFLLGSRPTHAHTTLRTCRPIKMLICTQQLMTKPKSLRVTRPFSCSYGGCSFRELRLH